MNLSLRRLIPYIILLISIVFILYYHLFLHPTILETQSSLRDISVLNDNITINKNKKMIIGNNQKNSDQFRGLILEKQLKLPDHLDSHDIIYILSEANSAKINKRSIIFMEPVIQEDFSMIPVRFSLSTDNNGILDFLSYLTELPHQPTISYMQISANRIENNNQNMMDDNFEVRYNLDVEMNLNFYVRGNME